MLGMDRALWLAVPTLFAASSACGSTPATDKAAGARDDRVVSDAVEARPDTVSDPAVAASAEPGGTAPSGATGPAGASSGGAVEDGSPSAGESLVSESGPVTSIAAGVRWLGRVDATSDPSQPRFAWSGSGFIGSFTGTAIDVQLYNDDAFVFRATVDGVLEPAFTVTSGEGSYRVASGLASATHTLELHRQTEAKYGISQLLAISVEGGALLDAPPPLDRLIEVVGASVSAGYGNLGASPCKFSFATESHWDSYDAQVARALGAELNVLAISGRGVYRNGDGSTDGTMPSLYDRILPDSATPAWDFSSTPQVVIINLGKNDYGVGDPGPLFASSYLAFMGVLRQHYPDAVIVCTTGPNLGAENHALQLAAVSSAVAAQRAAGDMNIELVDWAEETPAETGCDQHPTVAKDTTMSDQIVAVLRARLGW
jgi:hypothetical protein